MGVLKEYYKHEQKVFIIYDFPVTYYEGLNAIFLQVPKNATSTTLSLILKKLDISFDDKDYHSIHQNSQKFIIDKKTLVEKTVNGGIFLFTFSRNPYARLISCYKDKITIEKDIDFFNDFFGTFTPNMNFKRFAENVCRIPDFWANTHFKSQCSFIFLKNVPKPNFIGKVENYSEDIKVIQEVLRLPKLNQSFNITSESYNLSEWYNKDLAKKIYRRYKQDFIRLNYEPNFEQFPN